MVFPFLGFLGDILGFCLENPPEMGLRDPNAGGFGGGPRFWGSILGFRVENLPQMGLRDPHRRGGLGGSPFLGVFGGLWGLILGFCVENPPQMGVGDPNAGGFGGGSRFLGVSGGLWVSILGFCVENPPEMGLRDPNAEDLGGGPHLWGSLGVDFEVLCGEPPQMGGETPVGGVGGVGSPFLGVSGGRFWGSVWKPPPQMGLGDPNAEDLGGVPISGGPWGSLGVDFGVL